MCSAERQRYGGYVAVVHFAQSWGLRMAFRPLKGVLRTFPREDCRCSGEVVCFWPAQDVLRSRLLDWREQVGRPENRKHRFAEPVAILGAFQRCGIVRFLLRGNFADTLAYRITLAPEPVREEPQTARARSCEAK